MITPDTYANVRTTPSLADDADMGDVSGFPPGYDPSTAILPATTEADGTPLKPGAYIARLLGMGWRLHPTWGENGERMGDVPSICHFTKRLADDPEDPDGPPIYAIADYVHGQAKAVFFWTQIEVWDALAQTFVYDQAITEDNPHPDEDFTVAEFGPEVSRPTGWTLEDEIRAQMEYQAAF